MKQYLETIKSVYEQIFNKAFKPQMKYGEYDFCPCSNDAFIVPNYLGKIIPHLKSYSREVPQVPLGANKVAVIIGGAYRH